MKENIVRKPALLKVLHNVLKRRAKSTTVLEDYCLIPSQSDNKKGYYCFYTYNVSFLQHKPMEFPELSYTYESDADSIHTEQNEDDRTTTLKLAY
ncbi:jg26274 [Pararge aegeria aegeria]|uniref:Jg26274 protein n=1 Tax=Pararge aegeria aegeria TaxID=348720 RepID=A0A8S4QVA5_9NEOP|nr:jg26274 [Pararge aegeria aegeria]